MHHTVHHMIVHHSFWPNTLGAWGATLAALTAPVAAIASILNRNKISIVHDLVNGRLTQAIQALDERHITDRITERDTEAKTDAKK